MSTVDWSAGSVAQKQQSKEQGPETLFQNRPGSESVMVLRSDRLNCDA
jgi:hypothetical protein